MRNYCYEFVRNYGEEKDLGDMVNFAIGFFGGKPIKKPFKGFAYDNKYSNASEEQKYIINKIIEDIYSTFLYFKLNYNEKNTRIMTKIIFGIWKYNNNEFFRLQDTVRDVFGLSNFNIVQFVNIAIERFIKNDIREDENGVTLISNDIKPKWLKYFPKYDELNNNYYELHIKFEYDARKF